MPIPNNIQGPLGENPLLWSEKGHLIQMSCHRAGQSPEHSVVAVMDFTAVETETQK